MTALPIRKVIESELDELSDTQAIAVLEFIRSVKQDQATAEPDNDDPLVGFISGPTELAERSRIILNERDLFS